MGLNVSAINFTLSPAWRQLMLDDVLCNGCYMVRIGCLELILAATPECLPVITEAPSLPELTKRERG